MYTDLCTSHASPVMRSIIRNQALLNDNPSHCTRNMCGQKGTCAVGVCRQKEGPSQIRTGVAGKVLMRDGIKIRSDNHYTNGPFC
jgi:hypothetical protein